MREGSVLVFQRVRWRKRRSCRRVARFDAFEDVKGASQGGRRERLGNVVRNDNLRILADESRISSRETLEYSARVRFFVVLNIGG